jgi:hypothetical protein
MPANKEAALRARVAKALHREELPDEVWALVERWGGYVTEALRSRQTEPELIGFVRQLLALGTGPRRQSGRIQETAWEPRDAYTPYMRARLKATRHRSWWDGEPRRRAKPDERNPHWYLMDEYDPEPIIVSTEPPLTSTAPEGAPRRVVLSVESWVPAQAVRRAYAFEQEVINDGPTRPLKLSSLKLYEWVTRRREGHNELWRETMAAWNRAHPERRYNTVHNFHRDYHRVKKALVRPT